MPPAATKGSFVALLFEQVINHCINIPDDFAQIFDIKECKSIAGLLQLYVCKALANSNPEYTRCFLAVVHGGRVKNENPLEVVTRGLLMSMDLVSCYGKGLQYMSLLIGHPALLSTSPSGRAAFT